MGILIYIIMLSYVESSSPQRHGTIWVVFFGLFRSELQVEYVGSIKPFAGTIGVTNPLGNGSKPRNQLRGASP